MFMALNFVRETPCANGLPSNDSALPFMNRPALLKRGGIDFMQVHRRQLFAPGPIILAMFLKNELFSSIIGTLGLCARLHRYPFPEVILSDTTTLSSYQSLYIWRMKLLEEQYVRSASYTSCGR